MRTRGVLFRCVIRDEERKNAHYPRIVVAPPVHRATTRATTTTAAFYSRLLFRGALHPLRISIRGAATEQYDNASDFYGRSASGQKPTYVGIGIQVCSNQRIINGFYCQR